MNQAAMTDEDPGQRLHARRLPLGQFSVMVGPATHLAEERDRLVTGRLGALRRPPARRDRRRRDHRHRPDGRAAAEVVAEIAPRSTSTRSSSSATSRSRRSSTSRFARRVRRPGGPPVHPVEHRRARAGPLREVGRGGGLRERVAPRRHLARVPVDGRRSCTPIDVPDVGGDTLFSDMYAAYDGLDDDTKARDRHARRGARLHADVRPPGPAGAARRDPGEVPAGRATPWCCTHRRPGRGTST